MTIAPVAVLLFCFGRYGYHRDELYFLEAGRHPAWGYPDQPPLVPLLAHALDLLPGPALPWLRVPGVLIAIGCVLLALMAAGAVAFGARPPGAWLRWTASPVAPAVMFPIGVAVTAPVYPVSSVARTPLTDVDEPVGETVGWPRFVAVIARAYRSLAPGERATAVVLTSNYGEAGAVDRLGPAQGLPRAYSGHVDYWSWGPPRVRQGAAILVGPPAYEAATRRHWADCRVAGHIDNGVALQTEEQSYAVLTCLNPLTTWARIWPGQRHLA